MFKRFKNFKSKNLNWSPDNKDLIEFKERHWPKINKIKGYLSFNEALFLYVSSKYASNKSRGIDLPEEKAILEIGSYFGKSTICIALGLQENKDFYRLYSVDPIFIDTNHKNYISKLLDEFNVSNIVTIVPNYSDMAFKNWNENLLFSMIWIDGNHEYDYVRNDFKNWSKLLMPNGQIVFHDFYLIGVRLTIKENIFNSNIYSDLKLIDGNLLSAKKNDTTISVEKKYNKIRTIMTIHSKSTSVLTFIIYSFFIILKNIYFFCKSSPKIFDNKNE